MKADSPFTSQIASELENILTYWKENSVDEVNGGFVGQRDHYNQLNPDANKGIILNTRLLWTFSAIGNFKKNTEELSYAERAFEYLKDHFEDKEFGGVYWEVDAEGKPVNRRKQIYAQAFAIYALSEFYKFSKDETAKEGALSLFQLIEKHARDRDKNGYLEAFGDDWSPIKDVRLSEKDRNSVKTMNTHLHILEAYTTLLEITGSEKVREALENLTGLFLNTFYDSGNQHFRLFFDENWNVEGNVVSYGHDIEAVWLLVEAAKAVKNKELLEIAKKITVQVAETFLKEAYTSGRGVINEKDLGTGEVDNDRHWWPQAEAMVGLEYAHRISADEKFEIAKIDIWNFTRKYIIDHEHGEWFFRINSKNSPYKNEDKLGMWKCPYHNSRACILLLQNRTI